MATQEQIFIVKWMPEGHDINGCQYLKGDTNKAYKTLEEAEERAMWVANESRREVGVFALECTFRPPMDVERVDVKKKARKKRK
jgi:hypothetical protein